jgi:hypothetical protein
MIVRVPFTCEACGGRTDLIPAVGDVLRCPHCADERPFVRPPLLVVTGPAGVGKSTVCARLAGTIPGAALLDADILGEHHVSVVSPNPDYTAFWRSMMRLAHELAQNDLVVAYFSVMLPEQVLVVRPRIRRAVLPALAAARCVAPPHRRAAAMARRRALRATTMARHNRASNSRTHH